MKTIRTILFLGLTLGAFSANAMPIKWDFNGFCGLNCGVIGLAPGGSVTGVLEATDSSILDGFLSAGELTSFGFGFGSVSIAPSTHVAIGGFAVSPTTLSLSGLMSFQSLFTGATTLSSNSLTAWTARAGLSVAAGAGVYTVPEPSTILLLGLGLLAAGIMARRAASLKDRA